MGPRRATAKGENTVTALLEKLERQAKQLSREERERLATDLMAGLEREPLSGIDQAWVAEAERRYDELISGRVQGIPADAAMREIREKLRCRR
jgi:putative addiction module component (TIGR02574 family)